MRSQLENQTVTPVSIPVAPKDSDDDGDVYTENVLFQDAEDGDLNEKLGR